MARLIGIFLAGGLGSLTRFGSGALAARFFGVAFPYGTLIVNSAGCFLIGLVMHLGLAAGVIGPDLRIVLTVGFLGGLTTFSSFAYESFRFLQDGALLMVGLNVLAELVLGFIGVWGGTAVGRLLAGP